MEVEKGIAVGDVVFLIVHGPAEAVLAHHTLSGRAFALLRLHQPVYLSVAGGTDAAGGREAARKNRDVRASTRWDGLNSDEGTWRRGYRRGR